MEVVDAPTTKPASQRRWRRPTWSPRPIRERNPRAEVRRRDAIFRRTLAVADALAAAGAVVICIALVGADTLRSGTDLGYTAELVRELLRTPA